MSHKLLLADDSVTIQRVIELTFSGEDVQVLAVGDGEQAIARIPSEQPDIILADIGMPKRNGYEVAAFVKGRADLKHIPVLLLAGAFEPVDEARAKESGCDGVLVKPFEPQQVIARVRELLERSRITLAPMVPGESPPEERPQAPRTLEFPKRPDPDPAPDPAPEAQPVARTEPLPERLEQTLTPAMGPDESLDDYFDRLDAAFATLESASVAHPIETERDEVPADEGLTIPTLDDLLGADFEAAPPIDLPLHTPAAAPPPAAPPPTAAPPAPAAPSGPARSVIADAFTLLLAAEQDPEARPVRLATTAPAEPVVTDAMVDEVVRRVLARIGTEAVRKVVAEVVSDVAERLVREEIERIRNANG